MENNSLMEPLLSIRILSIYCYLNLLVYGAVISKNVCCSLFIQVRKDVHEICSHIVIMSSDPLLQNSPQWRGISFTPDGNIFQNKTCQNLEVYVGRPSYH